MEGAPIEGADKLNALWLSLSHSARREEFARDSKLDAGMEGVGIADTVVGLELAVDIRSIISSSDRANWCADSNNVGK
jgi:hypothetical protein